MLFQCKDWFKNTPADRERRDVYEEWREDRDLSFPDNPMTVENTKFGNVNVKFVHILFATNDLKSDPRCSNNEGAGSIRTMMKWLPMGSFVCENAVRLNELFPR